MRSALNVVQFVVFVLLCAAGWYSNHEGLDGTTPTPDVTHTHLIQYGRDGPHFVSADQFYRWEATWVVIGVLLVVFVALLLFRARLEGKLWWRGRTEPPH
jgi:hypothetical protein